MRHLNFRKPENVRHPDCCHGLLLFAYLKQSLLHLILQLYVSVIESTAHEAEMTTFSQELLKSIRSKKVLVFHMDCSMRNTIQQTINHRNTFVQWTGIYINIILTWTCLKWWDGWWMPHFMHIYISIIYKVRTWMRRWSFWCHNIGKADIHSLESIDLNVKLRSFVNIVLHLITYCEVLCLTC